MTNFIDLNREKREKLVFSRPGDFVVFMHNLSGQITVELVARQVNVMIFGVYTGAKDDNFMIKTVQHHLAPETTSNLLIKGVFDDRAKFHYQGLIRIEKSAQKSHAYQKNQNLILSPQVFVESMPFLEILANDVFCTHGSTTGRLNEEQLFYLKSRGLQEPVAKRLLVAGFITHVFDEIERRGFGSQTDKLKKSILHF
ncbi:SufD family Fe-S cluster assembly protein [Candidatus Roizmanbacteria bacterium]|nr:SufD family Fe-S cluster assembly protein [Candidatus Roizmanbacteria bacterium]